MIDLFAKLEEIKRANQQMRNETADAYNLLFNGIGKHIENNYAQQQQIAGIQSDTQSTLNALETGATPTFKTAQGASNYGTYQIADRKKQVEDINSGVAWLKENNKPLPADWNTRSGEDKIAHINKEREIYARDLKLQQLNEADARELSMFNKKEAIRTANDIKVILTREGAKGNGGLTPTQERSAKLKIGEQENIINASQKVLEEITSQGYSINTDGSVTQKINGSTYKLSNGILTKDGKTVKATNEEGKNIAKSMQAVKTRYMTALTGKKAANMKRNAYYAVYPMLNPVKGSQSQVQGSQPYSDNDSYYSRFGK